MYQKSIIFYSFNNFLKFFQLQLYTKYDQLKRDHAEEKKKFEELKKKTEEERQEFLRRRAQLSNQHSTLTLGKRAKK